MINWQYFPKSEKIPKHLELIVEIFQDNLDSIKSPKNTLKSNEVLSILRIDLEKSGYKVEKSKKKDDKIQVPVLFGQNGIIEKAFEADAYNTKNNTKNK